MHELLWEVAGVSVDAKSQSASEETELVPRLREGEAAAFEELYRRHVRRVYALAVRLSGREREAEEITQEVFTRAWAHRTGFQDDEHFARWLRRVAINLWSRERGATRHELADEEALLAAPAPATSRSTLRLDLERALAALPRRLRGVLVLFDVYGLSHEEIGKELALTTGSSKVLLHRARRRLQEMLS